MKFIHTFWSKPLTSKQISDYNASLYTILADYSYSCYCIKKLNQEIELYADKLGAEMLSFLPYDKIHIIEGLEDENETFFAKLKLYALKNCELGDALIDGDTFIQKENVLHLIKTYKDKNIDVIYAYFEPYQFTNNGEHFMIHTLNNQKTINDSNIKFKEPYYWPQTQEECEWMNTSLLIFNNEEVKNKYIEDQFYYQNVLQKLNLDKSHPEVILEQLFLTILCKNYKTAPIVKDFYFDPNANKNAIDIGFTHLGGAKIPTMKNVMDAIQHENKELVNQIHIQFYKFKQKQ